MKSYWKYILALHTCLISKCCNGCFPWKWIECLVELNFMSSFNQMSGNWRCTMTIFQILGESWCIHSFNKPLLILFNNSNSRWTVSPPNVVATTTVFKIVYTVRYDIIILWIRGFVGSMNINFVVLYTFSIVFIDLETISFERTIYIV